MPPWAKRYETIADKALEQQSQGMDERVSFFKLGDTAAAATPLRVVAIASKHPAAAALRAHSQ